MDQVMSPWGAALSGVDATAEQLAHLVEGKEEQMKAELRTQREQYKQHLAFLANRTEAAYGNKTATWAGLNSSRQHENSLRRQIAAVQNSSAIMRSALAELQTRVGLADAFLSQVAEEVPSLASEETQAVRPTTPVPTVETLLNDFRADLGLSLQPSSATSLLQSGSTVRTRGADETAQLLKPKLLETLSSLEQAHQSAQERMYQSFHDLNASASHRLWRVENETNHINKSWVATRERIHTLREAKAKLVHRDHEYRARLNGFEVFTVRVANLMNEVLEAALAASKGVQDE